MDQIHYADKKSARQCRSISVVSGEISRGIVPKKVYVDASSIPSNMANLIDPPEAAGSDEALGVPFAEKGFELFDLVHNVSFQGRVLPVNTAIRKLLPQPCDLIVRQGIAAEIKLRQLRQPG